jgi:molybdopterin-containing oxidoreductase family membrane subunit
MGLIIPGFIPGTLGEIYEYGPSLSEKTIVVGVWALGALIYTLLLKCAIPVYTGDLRFISAKKQSQEIKENITPNAESA